MVFDPEIFEICVEKIYEVRKLKRKSFSLTSLALTKAADIQYFLAAAIEHNRLWQWVRISRELLLACLVHRTECGSFTATRAVNYRVIRFSRQLDLLKEAAFQKSLEREIVRSF